MRKIKFRAWDNVDKKLYYPIDLFNDMRTSWEEDKDGSLRCCFIMDSYGGRRWLQLQQSTGISDIKGTEIYEGDLVKHKTGVSEWIDLVAWDRTGWFLVNFDLAESGSFPLRIFDNLEICGNILENKDMLYA